MKTNKYDFSDLEPDKEEDEISEDPREGFKITQCCGNCKYYYYSKLQERNGYCKLPNIKAYVTKGEGVQTRYKQTDLHEVAKNNGWVETHVTCVCNKHEFRSRGQSIEPIEKRVGKRFNFLGEVIKDDLD